MSKTWALFIRNLSRRHLGCCWLFLLLLIGAPLDATASTSGRFALVVGNADYGGLLWDVPAAPADARLVQGALRDLGFDQSLLVDASKERSDAAVESLAKRVAERRPGPAPTVLVYFSGRATPSGGDTILLPAGTKHKWPRTGEPVIQPTGTSARAIIQRLAQAGAGRVLLVLDASRALPSRLSSSDSPKTGVADPSGLLAGVQAEVFFGSSATPGNPGKENVLGSHSYFTRAFVDALALPGLSLVDAFAVARERVKANTSGRQIPSAVGMGGILLRPVSDWREANHGQILAVLMTRSLVSLQADLHRGDGYAAHFLGLAHWDGVGGATKDMAKAQEYFRKGAELGIGASANALGVLAGTPEQGAPDWVESARWFTRGAELGSAIAMTNLGYAYQHGQGVAKDARQAERLYLQAARHGSPRGHANLGWLYQSDEHGLKNLQLAKTSHERAIAGGLLPVAVSLSQGLRHGLYGQANAAEADRVLRLAAEQGCASCWTEIGRLATAAPAGETSAIADATQAFRKGAEGGDAPAMVELARRYLAGQAVAKEGFGAQWNGKPG